MRAAVARAEAQETTLVTNAQQCVLNAQEELLPQVEEVFADDPASAPRVGRLYGVIEAAFEALGTAMESLRRGTKRGR